MKLGVRVGRWSFRKDLDTGEVRAFDNTENRETCGFSVGWRGEVVVHEGFEDALRKAHAAFSKAIGREDESFGND